MPNTILIVEDEAIIAYDLSERLKLNGYTILGPAEDANEAVNLAKKQKPDLALLDVNIAGSIDGLSLGKLLKEEYNIPLFFLTSYSDDETLEKIMQLNPEGYMVKPVSHAALHTNIRLFLNKTEHYETSSNSQNISSFFIKTRKGLQKINVDDILFAKAEDNFTQIHTAKSKHLISNTLKVVSQKLPETIFIRIHRSYLVNINKIDRIKDDFVIVNETSLPVSRQSKADLMQKISLL